MKNFSKTLIIFAILLASGFVAAIQINTPAALAQTNVINVCSHNGTSKYNILGDNAATLRAKLDNPSNFGPNGAYGNYDFNYVDVGDNFTQQTLLDKECNIWFSGYESDSDYTSEELTELQNWVRDTNGQVIAGCDATDFDPVCALLNFSVTTSNDSYGFLTDTATDNPLNCNGALGPNSKLEMSGGAGGYFSGPGVTAENVLAVHEQDGVPNQNQPIVIYTGKYFLTSDINMIQTGTPNDPTLSDGPDVTNNNDILAMNAFSALADASVGKEICSSVTPAPPAETPNELLPNPDPQTASTCDCAAQVDPNAPAPTSGILDRFPPISIYSLDNGSADDSIADLALKTATGTVYGNPVTTADRFGNENGALLFDGVDDYIETNEGSNFKPLTFSVWFRADDISGEHSVVDSDASGKFGHSLIIGYEDKDGTLDVQYHNGFWDTGTKIEAGVWYHAFVTYGDEMILYLGKQGEPLEVAARQPYAGTDFDGSNFRFGRHNDGDPQWFKGAMDDIRFYDKALTLEEVNEVSTCTCPDKKVDNNSNGDVHISTPDGLVYDFQERGEFLLSQSTSGDVVLQARQERWETYPERPVSVNTAVAMNVAGDKLEFYLYPERSFYVNDVLTDLPVSNLNLANGGRITTYGNNDFTIYWPDGNTGARVILYGASIDIGIARLAGSLTYEGVLGNLDGNPLNDMQLRNADMITPPAKQDDLVRFGDSWRLAAGESLFDDALAGADTAESADPLTINDLDPEEKANAEEVCETAGVTNPLALHNCTYDVTVTGDESFVESAQNVQEDIADEPDTEFVAAVPSQGLPAEAPAAPDEQSSTPETSTDESVTQDSSDEVEEPEPQVAQTEEPTSQEEGGNGGLGGCGFGFAPLALVAGASLLRRKKKDELSI